jgi:hypothetical protein
MSHTLIVDWHPLGVIVHTEINDSRELLIEGEECCGISFDRLKLIAESKTHSIEIDDTIAATCRLLQSQTLSDM